MSIVRALLALTLLAGCSPSAARAPGNAPQLEPRPNASAAQPFRAANDVRQIEFSAPIPVDQAEVVSPLPNQRRLPATIAGLQFGQSMADTAASCLVPTEPVTYAGLEGETRRCSNAPQRVGASEPEVILYALSGSVNGMLLSYGTWQSAAAIIPEAYGDPTITEGEDEDEREVDEFRGETHLKVSWDLENGRVVLFYDDGWHLLFAYRD